MNRWILIGLFIVFALMYGWRFHPEQIPNYIPFTGPHLDRRPVFTQDQSQNVFGRWRPNEALDSFNGNRKFEERIEQGKQIVETDAPKWGDPPKPE